MVQAKEFLHLLLYNILHIACESICINKSAFAFQELRLTLTNTLHRVALLHLLLSRCKNATIARSENDIVKANEVDVAFNMRAIQKDKFCSSSATTWRSERMTDINLVYKNTLNAIKLNHRPFAPWPFAWLRVLTTYVLWYEASSLRTPSMGPIRYILYLPTIILLRQCIVFEGVRILRTLYCSFIYFTPRVVGGCRESQ